VAAPLAFAGVTAVFAAAAVVFGLPDLRRRLVTARLLPLVARLLPRLGDTEWIALEAGVITADERKRIHDADEARDEAIQVAAFGPDRGDRRGRSYLN
jgi:hypothetical protein